MNVTKSVLKGIALLGMVLFAFSIAHAASVPEIRAVPDMTLQKNSGEMVKAIDLRNYASDATTSKENLAYEIAQQSGTSLVDCFLQDTFFVSCKAPARNMIGSSEIIVRVTNAAGLSDTDTFNINVVESTAPATTAFELERQSITLEPGQTIGVQARVQNNTGKRQCYTLDVMLDNAERKEVRASPAKTEFCLNIGEETSSTVSLTALEDGLTGAYSVDLILTSVSDDELKVTSSIMRTLSMHVIDSSGQISIERTSGFFVCREPFTQKINLRIENTSGIPQDVTMSAWEPSLLPSFEFGKTTLLAGASEEISMVIHTNDSTAFGEYSVPVTASTNTFFVKREISFRLVECEKNFFGIKVTPEKRVVKRGEATNFTIMIQSSSKDDQEVSIAVDSNIPTELDRASVFLPANSSREVAFRARARADENFGIHTINVYAWNSNEEETGKVKLEVQGEHAISMVVENNDYDKRTASASKQQVFEVNITNTGAFTEQVRLSLDNPNSSIDARASETSFSLRRGEQKKVLVTILPGLDAKTGKYAVTLRARITGSEAGEALGFKVVEPRTLGIIGEPEITSYPKEVELAKGEERNIVLVITNISNEAMRNVKVRAKGTGEGIYFFSVDAGNIEPGKSIEVKAKITASQNASPSTRFAKLEVAGEGFYASRDIAIKVSEAKIASTKKPEEAIIPTGLLVLGAQDMVVAGMAGLLILLAVIILVITLLRSDNGNTKVTGARNPE